MSFPFTFKSRRSLKRLDTITRSPVYGYFAETMKGAQVIRALQQTSRFINEQFVALDRCLQTSYNSMCIPALCRPRLLLWKWTTRFSQIMLSSSNMSGRCLSIVLGMSAGAAIGQWLNINLQFISTAFVLTVSGAALFQHVSGAVHPGIGRSRLRHIKNSPAASSEPVYTIVLVYSRGACGCIAGQI